MKGALPKVDEYELTAGFFPCEAVGGDIYDCTVYDDKLVIYVADVSGHGVMPAMLAVFFSRVVRAACLTVSYTHLSVVSFAFKRKVMESSVCSFTANSDLRANPCRFIS